MIIKEAQSQWLKRAYDIAFSKTNDPEFSSAFASKLLTQTRLNPTHSSSQGQGIAQISSDIDAVDPLNPEEAIDFAASRDAAIFSETGDLATAMVGQTASTEGEEVAASELKQILENEQYVQRSLIKSNTENEDSSFTELDSPENRFRKSVSSNDLDGTTNVINDLIDQRVSHRASVR